MKNTTFIKLYPTLCLGPCCRPLLCLTLLFRLWGTFEKLFGLLHQAPPRRPVRNPTGGVAQRLEYELEKFTVKVQFLSPALAATVGVAPAEWFDLVEEPCTGPAVWLAITIMAVVLALNRVTLPPPGSSPSPADSSPSGDGDDPDKWKRYLKWAAIAVVAAAGVIGLAYLAHRYGGGGGGGDATPPGSPPTPPGSPPSRPINTAADLIQRLNEGGGTPAALEQTLRDLAGSVTPSAGLSVSDLADLANRSNLPTELPVVIRSTPDVVSVTAPAESVSTKLDRLVRVPTPRVDLWREAADLVTREAYHPGWDHRASPRTPALTQLHQIIHRDCLPTSLPRYESFKSITMQKAAHLHGITRDAYPDWCNYCRGRFAAVVDAAVNETAEIVREATAEGATPARAKDRGMGFWEVKRADLLESFAREYKQSRG